jgi:hypothetical protein
VESFRDAVVWAKWACCGCFAVATAVLANFLQTRFVTKLRKCDGALVLKVTNDVTCLKYKTDSAADVKNVERLTSWFLSQATRKQAGTTSKTAGGAGSGSAQ